MQFADPTQWHPLGFTARTCRYTGNVTYCTREKGKLATHSSLMKLQVHSRQLSVGIPTDASGVLIAASAERGQRGASCHPPANEQERAPSFDPTSERQTAAPSGASHKETASLTEPLHLRVKERCSGNLSESSNSRNGHVETDKSRPLTEKGEEGRKGGKRVSRDVVV